MLSRKQLHGSIIFLLVFGISLFAQEKCVLKEVQNLDPIGDVGGKLIFTKNRFVYECNETKERKGRCLKEEVKIKELSAQIEQNITLSTIDETFSGSLGELTSMFGAANQIKFLFSGWKGYCEEGMKMDFSWLQDPYMWANFAMTAALGSGDNAGTLGKDLSEQALKYARCAAVAGINTARTIDQYVNGMGYSCDPVDEFCDGEESSSADTQTFTLTKNQYKDMLNQYTDIAQYLEVIKEDDGVVLVRIKPINPDIDSSSNYDKAKDAIDRMKKLQLIINSVMTTAAIATCLATDGKSTGTSATDAQATSLANIASMTIGYLPTDPFTKIGLQLGLNFATSFERVKSCKSYTNAKKQGERHQKTYESKSNGMCHFINKECVDGKGYLSSMYQLTGAGVLTGNGMSLNTGCALYARNYCCYDSPLSKILTEQIKAQLARDWTHCTDISLKELQNVNLRQCTKSEMASAPDGVKMPYDASPEERIKAFQYKYKCVDLREYKDLISKQVGKNIPMDEFNDALKGIGEE